jgi:hypothetical protein
MSNMFKKPKMPTPQQVAPEVTAAQKRQEERLKAEEQKAMKELAARKRARQIGGRRQLLSRYRGGFAGDPTLDETSLGPQ